MFLASVLVYSFTMQMLPLIGAPGREASHSPLYPGIVEPRVYVAGTRRAILGRTR